MLLETFDNTFEYKKLPKEEMEQRGILGRLVGIIADTKKPTRNGRKYSEKLWENVFNDPIMQEKIKNRCVFGELGHPADRTETDMEKIAICLAEQPKKGSDGKLYGVFDILNTKCGQLLKTLCDYGCNIGISSRGEGDLITDYDGSESVDPETYDCQCWDAVLIPAVKEARLTYVTESLDKTRYNKTLRAKLQESLNNASDEDRKIMEETLSNLDIKLNESTLNEADNYTIIIAVKENTSGQIINSWDLRDRAAAFDFVNSNPSQDLSILYRRFINGTFDSEQVLARRVTDQDIDSYRHSSKKINIYVDGEWIPKNTDPNDIKQDVKNGKVVLVGFGSKITEQLLDEELNEINEAFNSKINLLDENLNINESIEKTEKEFIEDILKATISYMNSNAQDEYHQTYILPGNGDDLWDDEYSRVIDEARNLIYELLNKYNQPEKDDINEVQNSAVDNNEALVEELQNLTVQKQELEQKIISFQEKLSVCYAKETKLTEELNKYKMTIKKLAESSKQVLALQTKSNKLEESLKTEQEKQKDLRNQLSEAKEKVKYVANKNISLKENITENSSKVQMLNESISQLNEELVKVREQAEKEKIEFKEQYKKAYVKKLNAYKESVEKEKAELNENLAGLQKDIELQKSEYTQKIDKSKKLIEKYKKAANIAIDKYIDSQAAKLGSSTAEIKSRLPESYSFRDIDKICEELQGYNLNMSKLPFTTMSKKALTEEVKIKGKASKNESILPVNGFDDDIDDDLMYLAGK